MLKTIYFYDYLLNYKDVKKMLRKCSLYYELKEDCIIIKENEQKLFERLLDFEVFL